MSSCKRNLLPGQTNTAPRLFRRQFSDGAEGLRLSSNLLFLPGQEKPFPPVAFRAKASKEPDTVARGLRSDLKVQRRWSSALEIVARRLHVKSN